MHMLNSCNPLCFLIPFSPYCVGTNQKSLTKNFFLRQLFHLIQQIFKHLHSLIHNLRLFHVKTYKLQ